MKAQMFDGIVREIGDVSTRRSIVRLLGGSAAALGSGMVLAAIDADAKNNRKRHGKAQSHHGKAQHPRHGKDQAQSHLEAERRKKKKKCKGKHRKKCHKGDTIVVDPGSGGPHFTVNGRTILDTNGNAVLLRGVNKMSVWDAEDPTGANSFPEIRKTGANTVRIVWLTADNGQPTDPGTLDALITNARANGLVPMIELHDATGDWGGLNALVNYWTRPQIVSILQKHQSYLLVNIGNEVGDENVSNGQFISGYTDAVQRMRNAGIRTPLVIDAPDWGKDLETLNNTAAQLLAADPDHNLIFSVHLYWGIKDGANAQFIQDQFAAAVAANYPLIVGEFSVTGAYDPDNPNAECAPGGTIDYQTIIQQCAQYGIGWYAWEWGPGNGVQEKACAIMDMTPDRLFASLKNGWAKEVAITSPYSIKNTGTSIL